MLRDDDVIRVSRRWARILACREAHYDELVNVGYRAGKELNDIDNLHIAVKRAMQRHILKTRDFRFWRDEYRLDLIDKISNQECAANILHLEDKEQLKRLLLKTALSREDILLVKLRYMRGLSFDEIAKRMGMHRSRVYHKLFSAMNELQKRKENS
ncbi:MAG: hypothetical protein CMB80_02315 [Flammeovirgaceae bacterium]|nr:hypothetical protein [Flammeovirgaceae bacterium]